jgi:two-component system response regulator
MTANANVDILLVEDNAEDVELTMHALQREHMANNIFNVRDGEEAVEFLFCSGKYKDRSFDHPPRVVLLDLKLPKLNGLEVLKRLKSDPRTRTVPVVILTSSKEESDLVASYNLGANSYVQKPVDFDRFREIVKSTGLYWIITNQRPLANPAQAAMGAGK